MTDMDFFNFLNVKIIRYKALIEQGTMVQGREQDSGYSQVQIPSEGRFFHNLYIYAEYW